MLPKTVAVFAAFLSMGGLDLVDAQPEHLPNKKGLIDALTGNSAPQSQDSNEGAFNSQSSSGILGNIFGGGGESNTPEPTISAPPTIVLPLTLSVDLKGQTHTITGTPSSAPAGA